MGQDELAAKAKLLLSRRANPGSAWFYLRADWRRQIVFFVLYVALIGVLFRMDLTSAAWLLAGFFVGTKLRDVRWWNALAKEWPTTMEFLDWPKIEAAAGTDAHIHATVSNHL